jgi:hypothetical protein
MKKNLLLVTFLNSETLESFLRFLYKKFGIKKRSVFVFRSIEDEDKIFATFKVFINEEEKLDLKSVFRNTSLIHKKGSTFYTINALNKLIEMEYGLTSGNITHKDYAVDWDKYQNTFLLIQNDELVVKKVEKLFLES